MVVTVSELARGFGHLSQGRSAVREQYATKAEVWRAYIRQWQRAEPLKAQFWDRPSQLALDMVPAARLPPIADRPVRHTSAARQQARFVASDRSPSVHDWHSSIGGTPPLTAWQRLRSWQQTRTLRPPADDSGQLVNAVTLASLLPAGDCRHLPACGSARGPHARGPVQQRTGQLYIVKNRRTAPLMPFAAPGRAAGGAVGSNLMHPLHRQRRHQRPGAEQLVASWCASA